MVRVALVASLLGAAEGGFRMTGYRSLGCLSTSTLASSFCSAPSSGR